jgi:hypothetical protein
MNDIHKLPSVEEQPPQIIKEFMDIIALKEPDNQTKNMDTTEVSLDDNYHTTSCKRKADGDMDRIASMAQEQHSLHYVF